MGLCTTPSTAIAGVHLSLLRGELALHTTGEGGRVRGAVLAAARHLEEFKVAGAAHAVRKGRLRRLPLPYTPSHVLITTQLPLVPITVAHLTIYPG